MSSFTKSFVKKTKKGNLLNIVREHYTRDDIGNGIGTVLETNCPCYIIPDTNVVLHQITFLESPLITNVIILQTVLNETKNQNQSLYSRLRSLIQNEKKHFYVFSNEHHKDTYVEKKENETINDRNDRAIRVASEWYSKNVSNEIPVYLITNDKDNLKKAKLDNIKVKTIFEYVNELKDHPELADLIKKEEVIDKDSKMSKFNYESHKDIKEIMNGIKDGKYFQGNLITKRENSQEGKVEIKSKNYDIVLIQGYENMNRSIDGDIVAIEILPKEKWKSSSLTIISRENEDKTEENKKIEEKYSKTSEKPCGKVIGIIKRNWRTYCGSIDENSTPERVYFLPIDKRIPKIKIQTKQYQELIGKRISVVIDSWDINSRYPQGHYTGIIGNIGDPNTESKVILLEYDIPHYEFPKSVLECLPPDDWKITEEMIKERKDFRKINIFSIDPPGCKDIDDALHCIELKNGNFQIGVHIADVSFFVKEGTALDQEAIKRATTSYLVDRRIDMLPKFLTETLCSLNPNVERLAFSVLCEINSKGEILSTEFYKSIILSKCAFTYQHAQLVIDGKKESKYLKDLKNLNKVAKLLKEKRIEKGALHLASNQVKFDIDTETLNPTDVEIYEQYETNSLVEEFMLLANIQVAKRILEGFSTSACLRRHPTPNLTKFDPLLKSLKTVNKELKVESSKQLKESLDNCILKEDPYFNTIVRMLTTRCMEQAVYFASGDISKEEYFHYGLATEIYTHFTSPIRRYPDILVHRQLGACIGVYSNSETITNKDKMREILNISNKQHTAAQYAQRSSVDLYTNIYFKDKKVIEDAYIIKTGPNAIITLIPRYGIEGIIYLDDFEFDIDKEMLKKEKIQLKIFDKIKVKIQVETKNNISKCVLSIYDEKRPLDEQFEEKIVKKRIKK